MCLAPLPRCLVENHRAGDAGVEGFHLAHHGDRDRGIGGAQQLASSLSESKTVYDVRARVGDREISKTFARRKDAEAFAATLEVDKLRGLAVDPRGGRMSVEELARGWLSSNPAKRPDTLATDEYHLRAHILPVLGGYQIAGVTQRHIQALAGDLSTRLAPRTVRRALGVVRALFAYAVDAELIGRSPYRSIKLPRVVPTRRSLPTGEALTKLVDAVPERYQAMLYCATVLGLRFSEVAGLRVGELDLDRSVLDVDESVTRAGKGRPVLGPLKSDSSRRTPAIPRPLSELLERYLSSTGLTVADKGALVFGAPTGGPTRPPRAPRCRWRCAGRGRRSPGRAAGRGSARGPPAARQPRRTPRGRALRRSGP